MLNKPIGEIIVENGKVVGVKSEGEVNHFYILKNTVLVKKISLSHKYSPGVESMLVQTDGLWEDQYQRLCCS